MLSEDTEKLFTNRTKDESDGPMIVKEKLSTCKHCPYASHPFVPSRGSEDAKIVIMGIAPGAQEVETGEPFVGPSGQELSRLLKKAGVDRSSVFITNTIHCQSPDPNAPDPEAIELCRHIRKKEMESLDPKVMITLGNVPLKEATGLTGIAKYRGQVTKPLVGAVPIVPTYHPAFLLRSPGFFGVVVKDIALSKSIVKSGVDGSERKLQIRTLWKLGQVKKLFRKLRQTEADISVDFETTNLQWWKEKALCVGLSYKDYEGWVIPFCQKKTEFKEEVVIERRGKKVTRNVTVYKFNEYWTPKQKRFIARGLKKLMYRKNTKIIQNAKFDLHFMRELVGGMDPFRVKFDDTMLMQFLLSENVPKNLETIASLYTDMGSIVVKWNRMKDKYMSKTLMSMPYKERHYGCAVDAIATRLAYKVLKEKLDKRKGLRKLYRWQLINLTRVLLEAEKTGIPVSEKRMLILEKQLKKRIAQLESKMREIAEDPEFNPRAPAQVGKVLFQHLRLMVVKTNDSGSASTDEESLKALANEHEFVPLLMEYRGQQKLLTTYVNGIQDDVDPNWYVHPDYRITGARTGRLSATGPPIQTMPRGELIRSLFRARPGYRIPYADYSQIELRLAAIFANDKVLLERFRNGDDIHMETAVTMFGKPVAEITSEDRKVAKVVNFGLLYGSGAENLAERTKKSPEEMRVFMDRVWKRYRGLRRFVDGMPRIAEEQGYLENPFGRRMRFQRMPDRQSQAEQGRQLVNFLPQSSGTDITIRAGIRIAIRARKLGLKAKLIILIHDNLSALCPKEEVDVFSKIMKEEMERPIPELKNAIFPAHFGLGRSWFEAEKSAD